MPFAAAARPGPEYQVVLPRHGARRAGLGPTPTTIAPPVSGLLVHTANNRPEDPLSWQNEPGPGVGERPEAAVVRRAIAPMEEVARVVVPNAA